MGSEITFSSSANGDEDIYIMDCDGTNLRRITYSSAPRITNRTPEWSPDKSRIVFQSNRDGENSLYLVDVASLEVQRLTKPGGNYRHPTWSPNGETVLCVDDADGGGALTFVEVANSVERRVVPNRAKGRRLFNPCWVPASGMVAYVVQGASGQDDTIWTSTADGTDAQPIGPAGLSVFEFDYSPDASAIVFDARVAVTSPLGDWDIFVMRSDGSKIRRLTDSMAMSSRPKWMVDGQTIVFHTNRFGDRYVQPSGDAPLEEWFGWWNQFEICTMKFDGSKVSRLTANNLRDLHPGIARIS